MRIRAMPLTVCDSMLRMLSTLFIVASSLNEVMRAAISAAFSPL